MRVLLLILSMVATIDALYGQTPALDSLLTGDNAIATDIRVYGVIADYHSNRPIKIGRVVISDENNESKTIPVDSIGGWIDLLPCDHLYKVHFEADGYVSKHVIIDARDIPLEDQLGGFSMNIDITLFKAIDGVDYELLEKPLGISRFQPNTYTITWDEQHIARTQDQLKRMMKAYDKTWKDAARGKN